MSPLIFLALGFVLAVGWIDLKFDWIAMPYRKHQGVLPEDVLAPMTYFFRYVTGKPIVFLTALTIILVSIIIEIVQGVVPVWVAWGSLVLFFSGMGWITIKVVPTARRFGRRTDSLEEQSRIARSLFGLHLTGFILISSVLLLQLYAAFVG